MVPHSHGGNELSKTSATRSNPYFLTPNFFLRVLNRAIGSTSFVGVKVIQNQTSITDLLLTAQATVAEAAISAPSKHGSAQPKHGRYLSGENTNGNTSTVAHIAAIK